jgi:alkanesulfonate monooxygenase SsuD/methylene tetrahydromethanopterin reductase-like flavin-dependent oxidoreductase (luciferase family)
MEAGARSTAGLREEIATLRQYLDEEGRAQDGFTFSKRVIVAVENDRETAHDRLREWYAAHGSNPERVREQAVHGTPDDCIEGLAEVANAGVDLIVLNPLYGYGEQLDRLMREVVPRV